MNETFLAIRRTIEMPLPNKTGMFHFICRRNFRLRFAVQKSPSHSLSLALLNCIHSLWRSHTLLILDHYIHTFWRWQFQERIIFFLGISFDDQNRSSAPRRQFGCSKWYWWTNMFSCSVHLLWINELDTFKVKCHIESTDWISIITRYFGIINRMNNINPSKNVE